MQFLTFCRSCCWYCCWKRCDHAVATWWYSHCTDCHYHHYYDLSLCLSVSPPLPPQLSLSLSHPSQSLSAPTPTPSPPLSKVSLNTLSPPSQSLFPHLCLSRSPPPSLPHLSLSFSLPALSLPLPPLSFSLPALSLSLSLSHRPSPPPPPPSPSSPRPRADVAAIDSWRGQESWAGDDRNVIDESHQHKHLSITYFDLAAFERAVRPRNTDKILVAAHRLWRERKDTIWIPSTQR